MPSAIDSVQVIGMVVRHSPLLLLFLLPSVLLFLFFSPHPRLRPSPPPAPAPLLLLILLLHLLPHLLLSRCSHSEHQTDEGHELSALGDGVCSTECLLDMPTFSVHLQHLGHNKTIIQTHFLSQALRGVRVQKQKRS